MIFQVDAKIKHDLSWLDLVFKMFATNGFKKSMNKLSKFMA